MTPEEAAAAAKGPIGRLGGAFMLAPETLAGGKEAGYPGWSYYFAGRGGVLGDVDADVVAASLYFFPAAAVRHSWESAAAVAPAATSAAAYAAACQAWGRAHLAGAPGLDRLVTLGSRLAAAAEPHGKPLFAGWRAMPLPEDDLPGAAAQVCHVLREHRGAAHGLAVVATGLEPLRAILAGAGGAGNATFFGWRAPEGGWPAATAEEKRLRAEAETLTDRLATPAWAALEPAERAELAGLLTAAVERAFG